MIRNNASDYSKKPRGWSQVPGAAEMRRGHVLLWGGCTRPSHLDAAGRLASLTLLASHRMAVKCGPAVGRERRCQSRGLRGIQSLWERFPIAKYPVNFGVLNVPLEASGGADVQLRGDPRWCAGRTGVHSGS